MNSVLLLGQYNIDQDIPKDLSRIPWDQVWCMNFYYQDYKVKPDVVFQIHKRKSMWRNWKHEDLARMAMEYNMSDAEIMTLDVYAEYHRASKYPLAEAMRTLGRNHFTSTVLYMLALAVVRGFKRIALRGFNMMNSEEYRPQIFPLLKAIKKVEKKGVMVDAPMRDKWIGLADAMNVDLRAKLPDIDKMYHEL